MPLIQVFEHDSILINEVFTQRHWEYLKKKPSIYYTITHTGLKFRHFVGAMQVLDIVIEVLPKTDEYAEKGQHRSILLEMLQECNIIKPSVQGMADFKLQKSSLLDLYFQFFLEKIEELMQKGLVKTYISSRANQPVLKGNLIFAKQLQQNLVHKERFYTQHKHFSYDNPLNQLLYTALKALEKSPFLYSKKSLIQRLLHHFPKCQTINPPFPTLEKLHFNSQNQHYQTAIQLALSILNQLSPQQIGGQHSFFALMFDMNFLFEEWIFRQLKQVSDENIQVLRHQSKPFWQRSFLKPDIILHIGDEKYILDTKWKVLNNQQPDIQDLRQIFVYQRFFEIERSILLYPKIATQQNTTFFPFGDGNSLCALHFATLNESGKLNKNVGSEIVKHLENKP